MSPVGHRLFVSIFLCLVFHVAVPVAAAGGTAGLPRDSQAFFDTVKPDGRFSGATIDDVVQGPDGFTWIASSHGLLKYDGHRFQLRPIPTNGKGQNKILCLCPDRARDILWIGAASGLYRFDWKTEECKRIPHAPLHLRDSDEQFIRLIYRDPDNILWLSGSTYTGLGRLDPADGQITIFKHDETDPGSLDGDRPRAILRDSSGTLWVGTENGLNRFNPTSQSFTRYHFPPPSRSPIGIGAIYEDRSGRLLVGTWGNGIYRYLAKEDRFVPYPGDRDNQSVQCMNEDGENTLWVGTNGNGLYRLLKNDTALNHYSPRHYPSHSLSSDMIKFIRRDTSGSLWIGSLSGEIHIYNPDKQAFHYFTPHPGPSPGLSGNVVNSVHAAPGESGHTIRIGTYSGLWRLDRQTMTYRRIKHRATAVHGSRENVIRVVFTDHRDQKLWVGTDRGLDCLPLDDRPPATYRHQPGKPGSISNDEIYCIYRDRREPGGRVWVGTRHGLNRFNPEDGTFTPYIPAPHHRGEAGGNIILSIHEQALQGQWGLWAGIYKGGLKRFDTETGIFSPPIAAPDGADPLEGRSVRVIHGEARSHILWLGTDTGLYRFDPLSGETHRHTIMDSLPHASVYGILQDRAGHLWISTDRGLWRFRMADGVFEEFGSGHGQRVKGFGQNAYFRADSGEMFFGGQNGLISFFPGRVRENRRSHPIVITDFKISRKSIDGTRRLPVPLSRLAEIELMHHESMFSIEFAVLDYFSAPGNRYVYRLEGFDGAWIDTDARNRRATYMNLAPGHYTFRVTGIDRDGRGGGRDTALKEISLKIIIMPPYWRTWWFYSLLGLLVLVLLSGVYRYRNRRLRAKQAEEQRRHLSQKLESLGEMAGNIAHEIKTPLQYIENNGRFINDSFVKLKSFFRRLDQLLSRGGAGDCSRGIREEMGRQEIPFLLEEIPRASEQIVKGVGRLSTITHAMCEYTRPGSHRPEQADIHQLLEHLLVLVQGKNQGPTVIETDFTPGLPPIWCYPGELSQVFMSILVNAADAVHETGEPGLIKVSTALRGDWLEVAVSDTGGGIARENRDKIYDPFFTTKGSGKGTGQGLAMAHAIITGRHRGRIDFYTEPGRGTTFYIRLPVKDVELDVTNRSNRGRCTKN